MLLIDDYIGIDVNQISDDFDDDNFGIHLLAAHRDSGYEELKDHIDLMRPNCQSDLLLTYALYDTTQWSGNKIVGPFLIGHSTFLNSDFHYYPEFMQLTLLPGEYHFSRVERIKPIPTLNETPGYIYGKTSKPHYVSSIDYDKSYDLVERIAKSLDSDDELLDDYATHCKQMYEMVMNSFSAENLCVYSRLADDDLAENDYTIMSVFDWQ